MPDDAAWLGWNVMAWEKVALDLARNAGIKAPDSQLIHLGARNVLVVDRFASI